MLNIGDGQMTRKPTRQEVRERLPHIITNLTTAFIFWIISQVGPNFLRNFIVPGIDVDPFNRVDWIFYTTATLIAVAFLIRAISHALVFIDIWTRIVVRSLGISEKKPLKRLGRDFVYIILAILLAAAINPVAGSLPQIGSYLTIAISLAALAIAVILTYDMARILFAVLKNKADRIADWISSFAGEKTGEEDKEG